MVEKCKNMLIGIIFTVMRAKLNLIKFAKKIFTVYKTEKK